MIGIALIVVAAIAVPLIVMCLLISFTCKYEQRPAAWVRAVFWTSGILLILSWTVGGALWLCEL